MGRIGALLAEVLRTEAQFRLLFAGQVLWLVGDRALLGMSAVGIACALCFLAVPAVRSLPRVEAAVADQ